jgi:hypothetical protein
VTLEELTQLADGDEDIAGWLATQILSGRETRESMAVMNTARMTLEPLQAQFEAGDRWAAMLALRLCYWMDNFPCPLWARGAVVDAVNARQAAEVATFDEALQIPALTHLNAKRKRSYWEGFVYLFVRRRHEDQGAPIAPDLFDEAAEEVNAIAPENLRINATTAGEMYYSMKNLIAE